MSTNNGGSTTSQPSSILFFIAVAIGVVIALVFIFFSMRYYVRTKLGIYATARLTTTSPNGGIVLLTGDFPMHTFNAYSADLPNQIRRNRRRRRYLKKRRLTEQEVDHLFPIRTYQDWLDGGAERDADQREIHLELKQENDEDINQMNNSESAENLNDQNPNDNINTNDNDQPQEQPQEQEPAGSEFASESAPVTVTATATTNTIDTIDQRAKPVTEKTGSADATSTYHDAHQEVMDQVDLGTPYEPHYDSGTCAICIDTFDPEDPVRGLICGHVFHQECLDPWLTKRKACCPMCKRDYYLKNDEENEDEPDGTHLAGFAGGHDDLDSINQFTELQYTTLNERVAEILVRHPELEQVAKDKIQKYLKFKWRIFWVVMGISRSDLINSAIVNEDQRLRDEDPEYDSRNAAQPQAAEGTGVPAEQQPQQQQQQQSPFETEAEVQANRERVERMV